VRVFPARDRFGRPGPATAGEIRCLAPLFGSAFPAAVRFDVPKPTASGENRLAAYAVTIR
jgi:hypothetical protein